MPSFKLSTSFASMFDSSQGAPMSPRAAPMSPLGASAPPATAMENSLMLAMSAELEDKQEARRRLGPGGKVLPEIGASDDGQLEQQQQQRQGPLLSLFSPSSSASGGISLAGGPESEHLPPSERYWRERASLMGGRGSVDAHAARVRERRQVQAELRAWVDDVLEGQQEQEQRQQEPEQQKGPLISRTDSRWSDLPADLYFKVTAQHLPGSSAPVTASVLPRHSQHQHHHHHRHSVRARQTGRSSQLLTEQQQQQLAGALSHQQQQQQGEGGVTSQQQEGASALQEECQQDTSSSVCDNSGGIFLTPRTAQEFGDGLRQQFQQKVDAQVQQQLQQAAQQWQQVNLADQQLLHQLQQEHKKLQQQLADAHQQLAALKAGSRSSAGVDSEAFFMRASNSGELQQHEVLTNPAPDTQVLSILRDNDGDEAVDSGSAVVPCDITFLDVSPPAAAADDLQHPAPAGKPSRRQTATEHQPKATPRRGTAAAAAASSRTATPRAAASSAASKVATSGRPKAQATAGAGAKTPRRPGSSSVTDGSKLLSLEQQQALLARLKHAEDVMELCQRDLQASLVQQEQLKEQLAAAKVQLQQQTEQLVHQQPVQARASSNDGKMVTELQQKVGELTQQLKSLHQQLAEAQQSTEDTMSELLRQRELNEALVQGSQQQAMELAQLQSQMQELQHQLQQVQEEPEAAQLMTYAAVEPAEVPEAVTAAEEEGTALDSHEDTVEELDSAQLPSEPTCVHCQQLELQVKQLQTQLQQLSSRMVARSRPVTARNAAEALPRQASPDSPGRHLPPSGGMSAREQHWQQRQTAPMKTVLCPPPPSEVAAMQASMHLTAGSQQSEHSAGSVAKAISTGLSSLRGRPDLTGGYDSGHTSDSVALAGLHRLRPSRTADVAQEQRQGAAERGTAFLQLVGQCATSTANDNASNDSRLASAGPTKEELSAYSSLQLKGRSCSPRHDLRTVRPATAGATAVYTAEVSKMLQAVLSPRRPQTAASIPTKQAAAKLGSDSTVSGQRFNAVEMMRSGNSGGDNCAAVAAVGGGEGSSRKGAGARRKQKPGMVPRLNLASVRLQS